MEAPAYENPVCACGHRMTRNGGSLRCSTHITQYYECKGCLSRIAVMYDFDGHEIGRRKSGEIANPGRPRAKQRPQTLCWQCGRAYGDGCSWFRDYTPVPGWTAIPEELYSSGSYTVTACPEFVEDRRRHNAK